MDWPKAAFPCARTFQHSPTSGPRRGGPCRGSRRRPPLAPPEKLAGEAEHLALGLYHAGCRKLRVGRGPLPFGVRLRSLARSFPSPAEYRRHCRTPARRRLGARREAFKEHPTKPRARSSCAKTLAQGAWRDQNPKPARPRSRREPTPGSRTRNGAPDQASTPPTGAPSKFYRGPRQVFAHGADHDRCGTPKRRTNAAPGRVCRPSSRIPGPPTTNTGVPNKTYRGREQKLPGCRAKTTGVPDKSCRGPRQILPGLPTRAHR